jgi:competence ComEA-like helix-hairpin-helix protein
MIGPRRARFIVENRPFRSWEDLERVPGISEGLIDDLRHGGATIGGQGGGQRQPGYRHRLGHDYQEEGGEQRRSEGRERGGERGRRGNEDEEQEKIDLNEATREELIELEGVSGRIADAIVNYREEHGPFRSVDDLLDVPGISRATFERIKNQVTVGRGGRSGQRDRGEYGEARTQSRRQESERQGRRDQQEGLDDGEKIDINSASVEDLTRIPGISRNRAEIIVEEREKNGPFRDIGDLRNSEGIGERIARNLERHVTFGRQRQRQRQEA